MAKILVVEDDKLLLLSIATALEAKGHIVEQTTDGGDALELLLTYTYDLIILDWGLPGVSGIEILQKYRAKNGTAGILMLTGKNTIADKETGFEAGSDDYLTKPFDTRELEARVSALLRRSHAFKQNVMTIQGLQVDFTVRSAHLSGNEIALTQLEFAVLEFLVKRPNQFFTTEQMLNSIWAADAEVTYNAVRQCISRLRKKLTEPGKESIIRTSRGLGYRIDSD